MGNKQTTQTTETSIAPRTSQEQQLLQMLGQLGIDSAAQLGDLSDLASGAGLVPNAQDQALVEQSIGASSAIARRQLEDAVREQQLGVDESLAARGVQDSSIESVNRAVIGRDANRQFANLASQQQQQGADALLQLPFQRANTQINANQALFQRLSGSVNPALSQALQERLASGTTVGTTQESGASFGELLEVGGRIAAGVATGGASELAFQGANALKGLQGSNGLQERFGGRGGGSFGLNFNSPGSSPYYGR